MVLEGLGSSLKGAFKRAAGISTLDKETVDAIVRDIQRALLTADVDVSMVSELSEIVRKRVLTEKLLEGMTPKEHFVTILYDELVRFLGAEPGEIPLQKQRILVVGLFGSGKTTTIGKLAKYFKTRGLTVGTVACDTFRPAAKEQLAQISKQIGVPIYKEGNEPHDIAKQALKKAKEDVLIFDSAGRDALDKELAKELTDLAKEVKANQVLLVLPAEIGQAAKKQATEFHKLAGITGIIISKMDGTAKGGGALAAAAVSGAKVVFLGTGEKLDNLDMYDPKRFVGRLIGYGDVQGLLEKAKHAGISEASAKKFVEGDITLESFYEQIASMKKMGPLKKILEMVPGMSSMKLPGGMLDIQEEKMTKWKYIIDSMTQAEKDDPSVLKGSRIARIAKGSGTTETDVKDLLKSFNQMKKMMKMIGGEKGMKRGRMQQMMRQMGMKL
ncbi:MAG: signal recognition particle receptor subunit alpha [Nanoarchaeota archaeon]|nr:signal recognition particle receptor subunit alpha [Nanoarchaeota archaeon]